MMVSRQRRHPSRSPPDRFQGRFVGWSSPTLWPLGGCCACAARDYRDRNKLAQCKANVSDGSNCEELTARQSLPRCPQEAPFAFAPQLLGAAGSNRIDSSTSSVKGTD